MDRKEAPVPPLIPTGTSVTRVLPLEYGDLEQFDRMKEDLVAVNAINAPYYLRAFLKAKEMASKFLTDAIFEYEKAKSEVEKAWAIAKLDHAPKRLEQMGRKVTDGLCDAIAATDETYLAAKETERYWKALSKFLEEKASSFQICHDDVKKIYGQTSDPRGSSHALPSEKPRP